MILCRTCNRERPWEPNPEVPLLGAVCSECRVKLTKATLLDGAISGQSIIFIATAMQQEFDRRSQRLLEKARLVIERDSQ